MTARPTAPVPSARRDRRALAAAALLALAGCAQKTARHDVLPDPVTPAQARARAAAGKSAPAAPPTGDELKNYAEPLEEMFKSMGKAQDPAAASTSPPDPDAMGPRTPPAPRAARRPEVAAAATPAAPSPEPTAPAPAAPTSDPKPATPPPQPAPAPVQAAAPQADAPASAPTTDAAPETLSLPFAALCSRVEGYGLYTLLPSGAFVAGRPAAMVLYTEVDHFTSTPVPVPDDPGVTAHQTELTQTVTLYLDADGSRQAAFPEATIKDVARTRRRDFYLVQRLDLPRNLSVGRYNLKVTVRDVAAKAVAEATIPIEIVADPGVARGSQVLPATGPRTPKPPPRRW